MKKKEQQKKEDRKKKIDKEAYHRNSKKKDNTLERSRSSSPLKIGRCSPLSPKIENIRVQ